MEHIATVVAGSVENLGANGIAFSIVCCNDLKTLERHTICHAHTMTIQDLDFIIKNQYLKPCQEAHRAAEIHFQHVQSLSAPMAVTQDSEDCGCQ